MTFDESPPPTKLSPFIDDDVGEKEAIRNNTKIVNINNEEDKSIEVDEIINIKESKNHPLDQGLPVKQMEDNIVQQSKYIKELLKKLGLEDSKLTKTPMSTEISSLRTMKSTPWIALNIESPSPLDVVPEPVYPEYMPQEDEVFSAEEQPLPAAASPTAQSPDYVLESDPEADPEEDDDEDPEEDPVDYPADGGDDGDDEDRSSEDDEDDDMDIKADDDEEEEENPDHADSVVVALPPTDQAPSAEEKEPFETDKSAAIPPLHPAYRVTARISIQAQVPTLVWSDAEVARLLAIFTPPSSPLSSWLGIALGPAYEVRESSSAVAARPVGGLRADYGFVATMDREIRHDPERDVRYGITDSWDEIVETLQGQDTDEIYTRLDDEQSGRQLLAGRLNMLFRDRCAHARTAKLMETEARMSREAWGRSMDATDRRRQTVITEMLAADHKRQKQLTEAQKLIKRLQTQMAEFERQQGPAKGPAQPELPEEAGSSS
ncbi:hypothetical protein Tco_0322775 [Tanacetum coccineum]